MASGQAPIPPGHGADARYDLIRQLKRHVQEFNSSRNDLYIRLRELSEYARLRRLPRRGRQAEAKRESPSLFGAQLEVVHR